MSSFEQMSSEKGEKPAPIARLEPLVEYGEQLMALATQKEITFRPDDEAWTKLLSGEEGYRTYSTEDLLGLLQAHTLQATHVLRGLSVLSDTKPEDHREYEEGLAEAQNVGALLAPLIAEIESRLSTGTSSKTH